MKLFKYEFPLKNNEKLKILIISDIHYFCQKDNGKLEEIFNELNSHNYDAVFLVGDIIDSTNVLRYDKNATNKLLDFIYVLGSIAPTYIAYGSHDLGYYNNHIKDKNKCHWQKDELTFYEEFLNKVSGYKNVNIEENKTLNIKNEYTINIINPSLEYAMYEPDGNEEILIQELEKYKFLENLDSNFTNILLCHYPNTVISLYKLGMLDKVDLSISGHNHNGITQFKFIPLEFILNLIGCKNRGLITPGKSIALKDTKYCRGKIDFDKKSSLIINPSITTFANCSGILKNLDGLFYEGASVVEYIPEKTLSKSLYKKNVKY